jgi:hypothetical protein
MTKKQAQAQIDFKLDEAQKALNDAADLAEAAGIEFAYGFEGMGGGSYIPKKVAWDSSTAGCLQAAGLDDTEVLNELENDGLVGWVSSSANC